MKNTKEREEKYMTHCSNIFSGQGISLTELNLRQVFFASFRRTSTHNWHLFLALDWLQYGKYC